MADPTPTTLEEALAELTALRAAHEGLLRQRDDLEATVAYERRESTTLLDNYRAALERTAATERAACVAFLGRAARRYHLAANAAADASGYRSATAYALRTVHTELDGLTKTLRDEGPAAEPRSRFLPPEIAVTDRGARGGTRR